MYAIRSVTAPWCKCDTCGKEATNAISVEARGQFGRKGSRTLGYYCLTHATEKLASLRAKAART